jgi:hypothetical protein
MFEVNGRGWPCSMSAAASTPSITAVRISKGARRATWRLRRYRPWHGWTYDVTTGQSPDDTDARRSLRSVEKGEVLVASLTSVGPVALWVQLRVSGPNGDGRHRRSP